jgi:hypothetical protein
MRAVGYFEPGLSINLWQAHATIKAGRTVGKLVLAGF